MALRKYNGQLYQSSTSALELSTPDEGFSFRLQTWEDLKLEYGAESKIANNHDGSVGGYTSDLIKTSAGVKMRLDEWYALTEAWFNAVGPSPKFLQTIFIATITV